MHNKFGNAVHKDGGGNEVGKERAFEYKNEGSVGGNGVCDGHCYGGNGGHVHGGFTHHQHGGGV